MMPPPARNSSGSTKLKKAALGLRQNMRRSRRYWRQARISASDICRQLQVDVLECGARHGELLQPFTVRQRLAGQPLQERGGILGVVLDQLAGGVAVGDLVSSLALGSRAEDQLTWRPDRQHPAILDDRDTVGEFLGLLEVMSRQQDSLTQGTQATDGRPGRT